MSWWKRMRRKPVSVVMDDRGIRRMAGPEVMEALTWDDLQRVDIRTTSDGPHAEDVFFLLGDGSGRGVVVPRASTPEGLLERLEQLPGFDDQALIAAMGSTGDAVFHCWSRQT